MLNNKNIFISGATGSFGRRFIELICKRFKPKKIIIYSRDELKQSDLQKNYVGKQYNCLRYFIGDVRDFSRLNFAMKDVDYVIHAAALKHVDVAEYNPFEVIKTNVIGAQNIIDASLSNNVKKVIALSTDKASSPINLYGATKLTSDKLFVAANNYKGKKDIRFSVVRYGNVMGSRGSVIPLFIKNKNKNIFPVTDKRMTRFNITLDESVDFVLFSLKKMLGGEIFVPKIPSYKLTDIVKAISHNARIKIIGLRPGEKLHEEMISFNDSDNAVEFKNHFIISPNSKFISWTKEEYAKKNKGKISKSSFSYNSLQNSKYLTVSEIKNLIKKFLI